MSKPSSDLRRTHQPQPLYLALVTFADAQRHAAQTGHERWQAANTAFAEARQALHADAWDDLRAKHDRAAAAAAGGGKADDRPQDGTAMKAFVEAQHALQSGAAVEEAEAALYARFHAKVADIADATRDQIAVDQAALVAAMQAAFAGLDPEALDGEVVALLQQALQTVRPGPAMPAAPPKAEAKDAGPPSGASAPAGPPAKPPRAAKAAEDDHG